MDASERPMTLEEVMDFLRVSEKTAYSLVRSGELPAAKIGREWRVRPEALRQLLTAGRLSTKETPAPAVDELGETKRSDAEGKTNTEVSGHLSKVDIGAIGLANRPSRGDIRAEVLTDPDYLLDQGFPPQGVYACESWLVGQLMDGLAVAGAVGGVVQAADALRRWRAERSKPPIDDKFTVTITSDKGEVITIEGINEEHAARIVREVESRTALRPAQQSQNQRPKHGRKGQRK